MRKSVLYPAAALALGVLAACLRMWQRTAGYDASGLPVRFSLPAIVLVALLLLCAGAALFAAGGMPRTLEGQPAAQPRGKADCLLLAAAGALVLMCGALNLLDFFRHYLTYSQTLYATALEQAEARRAFLSTSLLTLAVALAALPAAVALFYRAGKGKRGDGTLKPFAVMAPPVFCWLWLIFFYRGHTSNPILWDYVLLLLAVIALLISACERAGFAFGVGKPRRAVFTSLAALLLAPAALPDCGGAANTLALIAMAALSWTELTALLDCLEHSPTLPGPADDATRAENEFTRQEDVTHE